MKKRLPPLGSLRAFDRVAELRSFKRAAEEIGVSPTAISHQIRLLETQLGIRVLERNPRHVALTDKGESLHAATRQAFSLLQTTVEKITEPSPHNVVTLTATTAFITHWLMPRLPSLLDAYPDLDLRLHADDEVVDMQAKNIDIAIRYGAEPDAALKPRLLFEDNFALLAGSRFAINQPDDLLHVPLIHVDGRRLPAQTPDWARWRDVYGPQRLDIIRGPRFTDETHALQAAIAGQGVAIASRLIAQDALTRGLLRMPFTGVLPGCNYYCAESPSSDKSRLIEPVRGWLMARMKDAA